MLTLPLPDSSHGTCLVLSVVEISIAPIAIPRYFIGFFYNLIEASPSSSIESGI
jgi:hypothetical protein